MTLATACALFISALLSATLLPGGSEVALATWAWQQPRQLLLGWGLATAGNVLGSMLTWWMGYLVARWRPLYGPHRRATQQALGWLQAYGYWALLLAWLPLVGDPLCLLAGWLRWSFWRSAVLILLGKAARYALIVVTASTLA